MSLERSEGVVLRGVDFSESSRIVTFLTPQRGRMVCMARGVKRPKAQLAGVLDTMNRLELVYYWKEGRAVQQLADASVLDAYRAVKADLEKGALCAFPLELADRVAHENEPSETLFNTLVTGFDQMAHWMDDAQTHCCWQVVRLLDAAGFAPSMDACAHCGKAVDGSREFAYAGGRTCRKCPSDRTLSVDELAALETMTVSTEACPAVDAIGGLLTVLQTYCAWQVDRPFRSVRVIQQIMN